MRTLLAPIESGRYHSFYDSSVSSSTGIYLPIFGLLCVIRYCLENKDWLKKISITLLVCYFIPFFNAMFNLFSSSMYTRWLYGMALIFSLITAIYLEKKEFMNKMNEKKIYSYLVLVVFVLLLFPSLIYILYYFDISIINRFASVCETEYFMGYNSVFIMIIVTIINYLFLWIIIGKKVNEKNIFLLVVIACTLNYGIYNYLNYDLHATEYSNDYYYTKSLIEGEYSASCEPPRTL